MTGNLRIYWTGFHETLQLDPNGFADLLAFSIATLNRQIIRKFSEHNHIPQRMNYFYF